MDPFVYIGAVVIVLLFLSGAPLAMAFAVGSSVVALFVFNAPLTNLSQIFFISVNSYPLLAMPFFILAGHLILRSGGMQPLGDFMRAMFGHWSGGLAVAAIIFATFLGSISGSSAACLAILSIVIVPIMADSGYSRSFSMGMSVVAGQQGLLIPPSLFFILFGALNQVSIPDLFLGGIGPGILTCVFLSAVAVFTARRRKYPALPKMPWPDRWPHLVRALPVIMMPVLVLGGIYGGLFSPTQAGTVSVVYSLLIGGLVYRQLKWSGVMESLIESTKLASIIYLIIIGADLMGKMLSFIELPQMIASWVVSMEFGPLGFMLLVQGILLLMGFVFSSIPMVVVALPIFLPTVLSLGIDPVFYGVVSIMNSLIGEITPPMGPQLWLAAVLSEEKVGAVTLEAVPFLLAMTAAMVVVLFVPEVAMFLVEAMR